MGQYVDQQIASALSQTSRILNTESESLQISGHGFSSLQPASGWKQRELW